MRSFEKLDEDFIKEPTFLNVALANSTTSSINNDDRTVQNTKVVETGIAANEAYAPCFSNCCVRFCQTLRSKNKKGFEHVGNTACIESVAGRDYSKSHDKANKKNSVTARLAESCFVFGRFLNMAFTLNVVCFCILLTTRHSLQTMCQSWHCLCFKTA